MIRSVDVALVAAALAIAIGCTTQVQFVSYTCFCECFVCEEYDVVTGECTMTSMDRVPFPTAACVPEGSDPELACLEDCERIGDDCIASVADIEKMPCEGEQ